MGISNTGRSPSNQPQNGLEGECTARNGSPPQLAAWLMCTGMSQGAQGHKGVEKREAAAFLYTSKTRGFQVNRPGTCPKSPVSYRVVGFRSVCFGSNHVGVGEPCLGELFSTSTCCVSTAFRQANKQARVQPTLNQPSNSNRKQANSPNRFQTNHKRL